MAVNTDFWRNKKVLITGHTGFKGSWLTLWLQQLGAQVIGYSLSPNTAPNLYEQAHVSSGITSIFGDIRNAEKLSQAVSEYQPQIVFHLAAQALVRDSYLDPVSTYTTNVMGSLNVLEAIRNTPSIKAAVMISSDKCYENKESSVSFTEDDPMGGHDPYSSSKGCMELLIASYRSSFFSSSSKTTTAIASARAGNVIGGGDWAQDRLVPDIIHAIKNNKPVILRYPQAIRPWQHVLEPLSAYMLLAEKLYENGNTYAESWNFGPNSNSAKTVNWVANYLVKASGKNVDVLIDSAAQLHESQQLKLNCTKARQSLNWFPRWDLNTTLNKVLEWSMADQTDKRLLCLKQISEYSTSEISELCNAI